LNGILNARNSRSPTFKSSATCVVVPPGLIYQWDSEISKFTHGLDVIKIFDLQSLKKVTVWELLKADVVIMPVDILESQDYMKNLIERSGLVDFLKSTPKLPAYAGQYEYNDARGIWIPDSSRDAFGGNNKPKNQERRDASAYFTYVYEKCLTELRNHEFNADDTMIPLEFFEWERVIVDEIHESLCTTRKELATAKSGFENSGSGTAFFCERNRRAGRELLGITQRDPKQRPLRARRGFFGLSVRICDRLLRLSVLSILCFCFLLHKGNPPFKHNKSRN